MPNSVGGTLFRQLGLRCRHFQVDGARRQQQSERPGSDRGAGSAGDDAPRLRQEGAGRLRQCRCRARDGAHSVLARKQCVNYYGRLLTDNMFCTGTLKGGHDVCSGDSGGPILDVVSQLQIGITSWGLGGCAVNGHTSVYTSVLTLRNFIKDKAGV